MFRKLVVVNALLLRLFLSAAGSPIAVAAEPLAPAIKWIPNDALLVVELTNPEALLDAVLCPEAVSAVTSNSAYKHLTSQDGYKQFEQGLRFIEASLGTDWQNGIKQFLGGGSDLCGPTGRECFSHSGFRRCRIAWQIAGDLAQSCPGRGGQAG